MTFSLIVEVSKLDVRQVGGSIIRRTSISKGWKGERSISPMIVQVSVRAFQETEELLFGSYSVPILKDGKVLEFAITVWSWNIRIQTSSLSIRLSH